MTSRFKAESIQDRIVNLLKKFDEQSNYEIELRFGEYQRDRMIPSVSEKDFSRLLDYFMEETKNNNYKLVKDPIVTATEQLAGKVYPNDPQIVTDDNYSRVITTKRGKSRKITVRKSYTDPNYPFYYTKDRIIYLDMPNLYTRLAKNTESKLTQNNIIKDSDIFETTRNKQRWSFQVTDSNPNRILEKFKIDLTKVTTEKGYTNYEVELEGINLDRSPIRNSDEIYNVIRFISQIRQNSIYPMTSEEYSKTVRNINNLFNHNNFRIFNPTIKPKNIKLNNLLDAKNLAVTDKADGVRRLMFLHDEIYLYYPPSDISRISKTGIGLNNTILDGEKVSNNYLVFDILIYNGEDVRDKSFKERLNILKTIENVFPPNIKLKKFYLDQNLYISTNYILDNLSTDYENDGLIFNDLRDSYNKNARIYKWKPVDLLTIDFQLIKKDDGFTLNVIDDNTKNLIPFPDETNIYYSEDYNENQIVEFRYNYEDDWEPIRIRHDRTRPNYFSTAESIWKDIQDPLTEETIRGRDLKIMRRIHNIDKSEMLELCESKKLLDIGSGRGGDIYKWKTNNINVYAVEPDLNNLYEFYSRIDNMGYKEIEKNVFENKNRIHILNAAGEESEQIFSFAGQTDCLSIFNALTFFFKSEDMLDSLITTIKNSSAEIFMGMVMDGEKTEELLSQQNPYSDYGWEIENIDISNEIYGRKIKINLEADAIVKDQIEYLVSFEVLKQKLGEIGFKLGNSFFLDYPDKMSGSQNSLSRLYRSFVFQKTSEPMTVSILDDIPYYFQAVPEKDSELDEKVDFIQALLFNGFEYKNVKGVSENNIVKLTRYLVKKFGERWNSPAYKKLRQKYGDFESAEKSLLKWYNWKPLKLYPEIADIFDINLVIDDKEYNSESENRFELKTSGKYFVVDDFVIVEN